MICTRLQRFSLIPHSQSRINLRTFVPDFALAPVRSGSCPIACRPIQGDRVVFVGLRADGKFCGGQVILNHIYLQPFEHEQLQSMIMLDLMLRYGANAGSGILNNLFYIGQRVWNGSMWNRSMADSLHRQWRLNDPSLAVRHRDEGLRIIPQELWDVVKRRQDAIGSMTVKLRGAVANKSGRPARRLLSGLLRCEECGGGFRCVNGREYGCASHRDGRSCGNGIRLPMKWAESKLLGALRDELLSPAGVALLERRIREHLTEAGQGDAMSKVAEPEAVSRNRAEIEQLRGLMKAGSLSETVALAAIEKAEEEIQSLRQAQPEATEKDVARLIRMLPRAAEALRERIRSDNLGLQAPTSIGELRNVLFGMFGGKVGRRPAPIQEGEQPYLIARVGLNRHILLDAAAEAAGCVKCGSGGRI